jgi:hypothetical protein
MTPADTEPYGVRCAVPYRGDRTRTYTRTERPRTMYEGVRRAYGKLSVRPRGGRYPLPPQLDAISVKRPADFMSISCSHGRQGP